MGKFFKFLLGAVVLVILVGLVTGISGMVALLNPPESRLGKDSILAMDLSGIILDNHDFLETLTKYRKEDRIKGVLITINSPGGVVGPSQEIFEEIKRTSKEFKKPVYVYCNGLAASGAYYAAVGADRIFTTPGCTMGSIGVIMDLLNLSELYKWAKVQRYSINTGQYKDAGAEYKALTPQQHELFQALLFQVLGQFKKAVSEGRHMKMEEVTKYADGRVWTGEDGVAKGFADEIGVFEDAKRALGEKVGLGKDPEVFRPRKKKGIYALFEGDTEGIFNKDIKATTAEALFKQAFHPELRSQPLFVLPGAVGL